MITQARLKELLHYDPDTGVFTNIRLGHISGFIANKHNGKTYRRIRLDNRTYAAHRLAWLYIYGEMPKFQTDHKDGCGTNNAIHNLRCVTQLENGKNRRLDARNNTGFNGVRWRESIQKYIAEIRVKGKSISLGSFFNLEDAISARKNANKKYEFHENHGQDRPL